jgi:NAD(P)-dependent dehydrogenase (short-subunit alcohol dehydrogenase family)
LSKVIVITGAGEGLGRTLARRFAADGDSVVLLGRTLSKLEAVAGEIGERATAIACDVSKPEAIRAAFARIAERHPKIDVLINSAAVFEPGVFAEADDDWILRAVNTNLTGAMLCARAALQMMEAGGHIINVSSDSLESGHRLLLAYQTSKAGLERFSQALRKEVEADGVRVTAVRCGAMLDDQPKTGMNASPEMMMRFMTANLEAGLNLMQMPVSRYESLCGVFRLLIDLPADLHIYNIQLEARAPRG